MSELFLSHHIFDIFTLRVKGAWLSKLWIVYKEWRSSILRDSGHLDILFKSVETKEAKNLHLSRSNLVFVAYPAFITEMISWHVPYLHVRKWKKKVESAPNLSAAS